MADGPDCPVTVASASARLLAGTVSSADLVEGCLARIEAVDDTVHSYAHVAADEARRAAREADIEISAGRWRGPLHGIPFGVKDNYDAVGMPAAAGSRLRLAHIPPRDAALVARLKEAGAVLIGKFTTWEFGTGNGGEYFDLPFPPARNPWDPERFTGGSSTGAGAAVAAGTALFALGSDTTGSVRLPAAATGTVGMIATQGRLDADGILANCYSLDVPGAFAWTVEDLAIVLEVLDAAPPSARYRRAAGRDIRGACIGIVRDPGPGFPAADRELAAALDAGVRVLESLGARIIETTLPVAAADCFALTRLIGPAESASIHRAEFRERSSEMGFALRDKLTAGSAIRAVDYIGAIRRRGEVARAIDALVSGVDALVTFGALTMTPRLGVEPEMTRFTVETVMTPFNLSGHPALVQCNGYSPTGLPLHWQIVGNRGDESTVLAVAAAYERATPWRDRRPPI